jgi:hypothetical protein
MVVQPPRLEGQTKIGFHDGYQMGGVAGDHP